MIIENRNSEIEISVFKNKRDVIQNVGLKKIMSSIKNGDFNSTIDLLRANKAKGGLVWKEQKNSLPGFTVSGKFDKVRQKQNILVYTGIIGIDFDDVNINIETENPVINAVNSDPHTLASFISPSGNGFKIFARVSSGLDLHDTAYHLVTDYYQNLTNWHADTSGKDYSRLCYISSDPNAYYNENAEVINVMKEAKEAVELKNKERQLLQMGHLVGSTQFEKVVALTLKRTPFIAKNHHMFIVLLSGNCNRWGIPMDEALSQILNSEYNFKQYEVITTVKSVYKDNVHEFGKFPLNGVGIARIQAERAEMIASNSDSILNNHSDQSKYESLLTLSLGEMFNIVKLEPKPIMIYWAIKENSAGLIYGIAKTGKTIYCENLGMSIASGRDSFLERPINIKNRKVLFISLEENYLSRTERNEKQFNEYTEAEKQLISKNYIVASKNIPRLITNQKEWDIIRNEVYNHKPGVVIIDSLTRLVNDQIEQVETAKTAMLRLRDLAEEYQTTVIVIHHSTKIDYSQPMTQQNLAGSRVISQEADFIIGINKTLTKQSYIKLVSARYADDSCEFVDMFSFNEHLNIKLGEQAYESKLLNSQVDGRKNDSNTNKIFSYFLNNPEKEIETAILKEQFVDKDMSEPTLQANLTKLINQGKIMKLKQGVYQIVS